MRVTSSKLYALAQSATTFRISVNSKYEEWALGSTYDYKQFQASCPSDGYLVPKYKPCHSLQDSK